MKVGLWKNSVAPPNTTMIARLIHSMVSTLRCFSHTSPICRTVARMATKVAIRIGACAAAMPSPSQPAASACAASGLAPPTL